MDLACTTMHPKGLLIFKMKEHVDLHFHALSHFIIHNCKENIFSPEYFALISSLKKKLDLNPMEEIGTRTMGKNYTVATVAVLFFIH